MYVKCSVECITAVQLKKVDENKAKRRDGQSPDTSGCSDITAVDSDFSTRCHGSLPKMLNGFYSCGKKRELRFDSH